MTVCIGALCEAGKSIVIAADRMVTFGPPMSLQAEPPTLRKIFNAGQSCVMLFSGGVPDGEELISNVVLTLGGSRNHLVAQVAEIVRNSYVKLKTKRVEENILGPLLGSDYATFRTLVAQSSSSQLLQQVLGMIMQHNLQLEILIAGTDATGGHLFAVTHPGQILSVNMVGYAAIGSGGMHAAVALSLGGHTAAATLCDAVFNVYEAKKAAEVAPGVGNLTDIAIVKNGQIFGIKHDLLDILEEVHKEKPTLSPEETQRIKEACDAATSTTGTESPLASSSLP
jgi:ATP-dependent protease HslVU (ClpYQ) peptidase subunit